MLIYGRGDYVLSVVVDKRNVRHFTDNLPDSGIIGLLQDPPASDVSYLTKAMLYKTSLEFKVFRKTVDRGLMLSDIEYHDSFLVKVVPHNNTIYYQVDLGKIPQRSEHVFSLNTETGKHIATAVITKTETGKEVYIFSEYPLMFVGTTYIETFKVYSSAPVFIQDDLCVDDLLLIHASAIDTKENIELNTKQIIFHAEQEGNFNGLYKANNIEITVGRYLGCADMEADSIRIIAESGHQYAMLKTRKSFTAVGLKWKNHETAHIHSTGLVNYIVPMLTDSGKISTHQLVIYARQAVFEGQYFISDSHYIKTQHIMKMSQSTRFICYGSVSHQSKVSVLLQGRFVYSPNVKVEWDKITDPTMKKPSKSVPLFEETRVPSVVPVTKTNTKITKSKKSEEKSINIHANHYVELSGEFSIKNASLQVSSNYLISTIGSINQTNTHKAFFARFKAPFIHFGCQFSSKGELSLQADKDAVYTGKSKSKSLEVKAENFVLENTADLSHQQFIVNAKNSVLFKKGSQINITDTSEIRCNRFINHTLIDSDTLMIQADFYIYNAGHIRGKSQQFIAPIFISLSRLTSKQTVVTAYVSFVSGYNRTGAYYNTALISIAPAIFIQNYLNQPSLFAASISLFNVGLTICEFAFPVSRPITSIVRFSVNSAAQLYCLYYQIQGLKASATALNKTQNTSTILQMVCSATQALLFTGSMINLDMINASHLSLKPCTTPLPAMSFPVALGIASESLYAFLGQYCTYSLVNVNSSLFLGPNTMNYSLVGLDAGAMFGFTKLDYSFFNMDSNFDVTLGPSFACGYENYNVGSSVSLLDDHVDCHRHIHNRPILPWARNQQDSQPKDNNDDNTDQDGQTLHGDGDNSNVTSDSVSVYSLPGLTKFSASRPSANIDRNPGDAIVSVRPAAAVSQGGPR